MSGVDVYHLPTWDFYHPAIEHHILKKLNKQYDNIDPISLRKRCREYLFHQINIQKKLLQKMGVFGDCTSQYEPKASVSEAKSYNLRDEFKILNTLDKLLENGYLSKKVKSAYWCIQCQTALRGEEIEMRQYKSSAGYVKFPVCEGLEEFGADVYFLVQVFDLLKLTESKAIAVFEDCEYVIIEVAGEILIIQDEGASNTMDKLRYPNYRILRRIKGDILTKFTCTHPLFGIKLPVIAYGNTSKRSETGLFNVTPGYSPDDCEPSLRYKFNIIPVMDDEGVLTNETEQFCGFKVSDVDKYITLELEKRGYLALKFSHESSHPHCWICHTPAVFRPAEQWFFTPTSKFYKLTIAALNRINWTSNSDRQQTQMAIEKLNHFPISRQRLWGLAIPAIYCKKCDCQVPIAKSVKAMKNLMSKKGIDAWFIPSTDNMPKDIICSRCGSESLKKDSSILDNHFYSVIDFITQLASIRKSTSKRGQGAAKSGQNALTIDIYCEQAGRIEKWLPQFILTLNAVENRIPSITLHVNHNQVHPESTLPGEDNILAQFSSGEYCADVLRLWIISFNSENKLNDIAIKKENLKAIYDDIKTTLYSILGCLVEYDKSYDYLDADALCPIDRLALNRLMKLISEVNSAYQNRDFMAAFSLISEFCQNELNDFYLKAVADRLHKYPVCSSIRRSAQAVLWEMANTLVKLIAPITPFLAEHFWTNLHQQFNTNIGCPSVFLADWPVPMRIIQRERYERDWKQLLRFKTELTQILEGACHQGIINHFEEADVVVYTNKAEKAEILQNYMEDLKIVCSIARLIILQQEPEKAQELFQASNFDQIFFSVSRLDS
ncbi:MAG: class I tRNA ligase family protein [Candidatus Poribacteria bacterium]